MATDRLAVVAHLDPSLTMAAPQQAGQQSTSGPDRATLNRPVCADHRLVPLMVIPGDMAIMAVVQQHLPLGRIRVQLMYHDRLAAIPDRRLALFAAIRIGPGMDRIAQDPGHAALCRDAPCQAPARHAYRDLDLIAVKPQPGLPQAANRIKRVEYQADCVPHILVRRHLDGVASDPVMAGRSMQEQLAPLRFGLDAFL